MTRPTIHVNRCVCFGVSFETLRQWSAREGGDLEAIRDRFGCGRGCGLCTPYLRIMLATGRTEIPLDAPETHLDL